MNISKRFRPQDPVPSDEDGWDSSSATSGFYKSDNEESEVEDEEKKEDEKEEEETEKKGDEKSQDTAFC